MVKKNVLLIPGYLRYFYGKYKLASTVLICMWTRACVCVVLSSSVTMSHPHVIITLLLSLTITTSLPTLKLYQMSLKAQLNIKINLKTKCLLGMIICIYCV